MKAFLTLAHNQRPVGTLHLELYHDTVPLTVQNFGTLLRQQLYAGSVVHRLIPGFMLQAGDFEFGNGTGGYSSHTRKKTLRDENFLHQHDRRGMLSMANAGPHTNASQFFVTFRATPHLNGKHVVFGHVDLTRSGAVLDELERIPTNGTDNRPLQDLIIVECGVVEEGEDKQQQQQQQQQPDMSTTVATAKDEDEIDLDDDEEEGQDNQNVQENADNPADDDAQPPEEEEDDTSTPLTKQQALKQRLRQLKQKMNQARQLNKQAVKQEGEKSTVAGTAQERKRRAAQQKQAKTAAWEAHNQIALATASKTGVDAKILTEQAVDSIYKATRQAEKDELNQYSVNDYHNPQGQYRNYERNVKSLPAATTTLATTTASSATFNPLLHNQSTVDSQQERDGARRLAAEMHRRIEKRQKRELKRKERQDADDAAAGGDVSYINQRNKKYNEKLSRTYDKHTAETKQNLERGTAL